ncbi:MFS transporter [Methanocella sp. MCL-LM]|uniref:MFS transporter n=1 Tax=Methanocella sp. MCL-LM TaxID=3412035 RepID=UPI003C763B60
MQKENKVLLLLIMGMLMASIDATIVVLALPAITDSLHTNLSLSIWVIVVYLLVVSVATTQFGRLGDLFGRSRLFNLGMAVFTIGSALCGLAPNVLFLIFSRAVQAIGGSMLEANTGAIIADTFEPNRRGRAYGYTGMSWTAGAVIGIVLGGVLTTFLDWRYIFYLNLPIGIIGLIFGMRYLKDRTVVREEMDLPGMVLLAAALSLISFGLIDFVGVGMTTLNLTLIAAGAILIPVFLWWESRSRSPIIHLDTFRHKVLRSSILASFFESTGYLSVAFLLTLYLQGVRGLSPLDTALLTVPGYLLGVLGPYVGGLADRFGARVIATAGIALMCVTVLIYLTLEVTTPLYVVVLASLFAGVGSAMFYPANNSAVMACATADRHGSTSGLLRTMANIGTLGSYVLSITVASAFVSRETAFSVFMGASRLEGGLSPLFLNGLDAAFGLSFIILVIGGLFSVTRGKENRSTNAKPKSPALAPTGK